MYREKWVAVSLILSAGVYLVLLFLPHFAFTQTRVPLRIVSNTELVQLAVLVFDERGGVATNLRKQDFRIVEDGEEQNIINCERERVSVSFVIVADVSSSMTNKIPFVQQAALDLVEPPDPQQGYTDEFSVLGIDTRVRPLVPFTADRNDLEHRLPELLIPTNGSTALFDGIYYGATRARRDASNKHQAMIIISDGGDNHSRYSLVDVKRLLEEVDMPVFAVMSAQAFFEPPAFLAGPPRHTAPFPQKKGPGPLVANLPFGGDTDYIGPAERRGPHNLKAITEASGGGVFTAKEPEDLPRIVRTIGLAVRYHYLLTYKPRWTQNLHKSRLKASADDGWHRIQLELYPQEKFKGYSLPYYKRRYHAIE
jgi:VWFA-related protein